jgi:23S rRNA (adenine2503-C2)-methyltransferase
MTVSLDLATNEARAALAAQARTRFAEKPSLIGLSRAELGKALVTAGVPERQAKMRSEQLWHWLYVRGAADFAGMFNISKDLRALLSERFSITRPEIVEEQVSNDGTR